MTKHTIWVALMASAVAAFTPAFVPRCATKYTLPACGSMANGKDDAWDRLTDQYHQFQNELLRDLVESEDKKEHAEKIAEVMLKKASDLKVEYKQLQDELLRDLAEHEEKMEHAEKLANVMLDKASKLKTVYTRLQDELLRDLAESEKKKEHAEEVAEVMLRKDADLKKEYSQLQDELLSYLAEREKKREHAEEVAKVMFEKATDMTALKRYQQIENLDQAERKLQAAHGERDAAEALNRQAHDDFISAQEQVSMLESVDDEYDDQERLRDMSVAHAAHHLEEDSKDRVIGAMFHELEAKAKRDEATDVLKNLEENEEELKATLKDLNRIKKEKFMEQWKFD